MLVVTGTLAYDYIMDFPESFSDHILPDQIHKINLSFIVDKFAKRRGGTAGNTSYSLALLKTPHGLISYAGKDFREYREVFEKLGVSLSAVKIDKNAYTSTGFAMTDKADNQIWGYFYGAGDKIPELVLPKNLGKEDLVLIGPSGARGSMNFVNQCIERDIPYMFDPGFILTQVTDRDLVLGVKHAKYIIGNDYEIELIKKRLNKWEKLFAEKVIITTLGAEGTCIEEYGKKITIKPAKVKKALDPTGAGDAWRGGFLAGLKRKYDLKMCGQMGSVAAAYAVEVYGTQEYSYSLKDFQNRYRQSFGTLLEL